MNHMKQVAEMMGVELGEEFKIYIPESAHMPSKFRITEEQVECYAQYHEVWDTAKYEVLSRLLTGDYCIEKMPKFPEYGAKYWFILINGEVCVARYNGTVALDAYRYKMGNFYLTKEEAEADKDKWVAFFADPTQIKIGE